VYKKMIPGLCSASFEAVSIHHTEKGSAFGQYLSHRSTAAARTALRPEPDAIISSSEGVN
jgi:hypothetical protein